METPDKCPACGFDGRDDLYPPGAWMWGARCLQCGVDWRERKLDQLEQRLAEANAKLLAIAKAVNDCNNGPHFDDPTDVLRDCVSAVGAALGEPF